MSNALERRVAKDIEAVREAYPELIVVGPRTYRIGELFFELPESYPFKMPHFWTDSTSIEWNEDIQWWSGAIRLLPVLVDVLLLTNKMEGPLRHPVSLLQFV